MGASLQSVLGRGAAFSRIAQFHPELTAFRRDLHAHPELGFEEVYTSARVREALGRGELPAATVDGLRIGAPVARPTAVICIGQNYAAHAAESAVAVARVAIRDHEDEIILVEIVAERVLRNRF